MNCLFIYLPPFFVLFSFWWQRGICVCIYSSMIPGLKAVCVFAECDTSFVIPNLNPCIFSPSQTSYHQMLRFSALFMLETNINTSWYQLQTVSNWSAITLKKHCKKNTCRSPNTHTHTHTVHMHYQNGIKKQVNSAQPKTAKLHRRKEWDSIQNSCCQANQRFDAVRFTQSQWFINWFLTFFFSFFFFLLLLLFYTLGVISWFIQPRV